MHLSQADGDHTHDHRQNDAIPVHYRVNHARLCQRRLVPAEQLDGMCSRGLCLGARVGQDRTQPAPDGFVMGTRLGRHSLKLSEGLGVALVGELDMPLPALARPGGQALAALALEGDDDLVSGQEDIELRLPPAMLLDGPRRYKGRRRPRGPERRRLGDPGVVQDLVDGGPAGGFRREHLLKEVLGAGRQRLPHRVAFVCHAIGCVWQGVAQQAIQEHAERKDVCLKRIV
mmetsp:Transcript_27134/g.90185  ORF Transcript_27134/g.90185 Transcript_27134/m.90185 type:complete len:230 (-) Transcript_27134:1835-2524(-)